MLSKEMVVQRYIHNPLLVDGYKFDLRIYVVIMGTDGPSEDGWVPSSGGNYMKSFMCTEGLARFCTVITYILTFVGTLPAAYKEKLQGILHAPDELLH